MSLRCCNNVTEPTVPKKVYNDPWLWLFAAYVLKCRGCFLLTPHAVQREVDVSKDANTYYDDWSCRVTKFPRKKILSVNGIIVCVVFLNCGNVSEPGAVIFSCTPETGNSTILSLCSLSDIPR